MIIIGIAAYQKASDGMTEKFEASTMETVKMATQYIDMSCDFIKSDVIHDCGIFKAMLLISLSYKRDSLNILISDT